MKNFPIRGLFAAGLIAGLTPIGFAQIVQLNASISGANETPANSSPATGNAIMLYDVSKNTYDLMVTINNLANTISNSHIHEAAAGVPGPVISPLGAESLYTRSGNTVTATFHDITYPGTPATLLSGGSYYNLHTSQFPGGEVRGQLVPQAKRLTAVITAGQEQAAQPAGTTINSNARGAAVMWFDPAAKTISLRVNLYNFTNTLTNSHFHEAAVGVSGGVVTPLGNASVYTSGGNGFYSGTFDIPYTGDTAKLLTGAAYLNFHSNVYPGGEIRGQVLPDDETPGSGVVNVSALGQVTSSSGFITGFTVQGPEPVQVLITAKGPSLAAYGVANPLSDPTIALYDSSSHWLAANNDVGTPAASSDLAKTPGVPTNGVESAMLIVLPPGQYTVVATGNGGATGAALVEVTNARVFGR